MNKWIRIDKVTPTREWLQMHGWHPTAVLIWNGAADEKSGWATVPYGIAECGSFTHWMPIEPPGAETIDPDNPLGVELEEALEFTPTDKMAAMCEGFVIGVSALAQLTKAMADA